MQSAEVIAAELAKLTKETLNGVGVFDTLMRTVKLHLSEEYDSQRITGHEYATVYLGAITAVLQTSAQFLVNVANAAHVDAQIAALQAQTINDNSRTANEIAKTAAEIAAMEAATDNSTRRVNQEILLMAGQLANDSTRTANDTAKANAEVSLMTARESNETLKISEEITASQAQTVNTTNKVNAEVSLINTQRTNDTTRTANDTTRAANETAKVTAENNALAARNAAEVALLNQKVATEVAQTSDTVPAGIGVAPGAVAGVVKNQRDLYVAQADGFKRDAEQKVLKCLTDTWSMQASSGLTVVPGQAGLGESQIKDVVNKARAGIGVAAIP